MISYDDVFRIGKIGKPHGVKGELTMHIDDDVFDRTDADYVILSIDGTLVPFFFEEYRFRTDETVLVKFADIDTTDEARRLTGCEVYFERNKSQAEDSSSLSWAEIVGFNVVDSWAGTIIGKVENINLSTINTLFEVRSNEGKEILIPVVDEIINHIDADKREITVTLPEGLLEI
mgnify:CR=1 FL=1